jgi:hypothetical protein
MATITMHWDGIQWSIVPSPSPGTSNELFSVAAASSNEIWAVGQINNGSASLLLHWNGTSWTSVAGSPNTELDDIVALSANDVWAVGTSALVHALSMHWDGTSWSIVPAVSPANATQLFGVANAYSNRVWAVGYYRPDGSGQYARTLVEIYTEDCPPTVTTTPTYAATVSTTHTTAPTSTIPIIATTTATRTPTLCPIQFTDVPTGSTFYPHIRCLACRGIINGYPDNTFRPNNNVTRGQLSKIVSNALDFSDPQTGQMFEDVPVGSTFQVYIGRLASRDIIAGYPCGGLGEPCVPPGNRPYFRPDNTATRGQLTKIMSNAEGFNQPVPAGQQTFADVPAGSTYYLYVERLLMNRPGVMSGYPCGGPGEPCDAQHRPYFRPNNSLTRGQTAKIVANTVFPSCATP